MITPNFFTERWRWYQPILERGEEPTARVRLDLRRMPLRVPTKEATEAIPYAAHPDVRQAIQQAMHRLGEYARRYYVDKEPVSLHRLPKLDAHGRAQVQALRADYPHLPVPLLHHWCADERGAPRLFAVCRALWEKAWAQQQRDQAPWVVAVHALILGLIRQAAASANRDQDESVDHAMLCVGGGLFQRELAAFLREQVGGDVDLTTLAALEGMAIAATPFVFIGRQLPAPLIADDPRMIRLYGLEPELVPRMRALRAKLGFRQEGGMLNLLVRDALGDHLLRRAWARLSLWEVAIRTRNGKWMQWVLDVKALDRLLRGERPPPAMLAELSGLRDMPFAAWFLSWIERGKPPADARPWTTDMRVLNAFRVFEEDARIEGERRKSEAAWLDQGEALAGRMQGAEAVRKFEAAWREGEIVWITTDPEAPLLHGAAATVQGCLRISWSDYLAAMLPLYGEGAQAFLAETFAPKIAEILSAKHCFVESLSGEGALVRGETSALVRLAGRLRAALAEWWQEVRDDPQKPMPLAPIGIAVMGDWLAVSGARSWAFSTAVAVADGLIAHEFGAGRLLRWRAQKRGSPLGAVWIEKLRVSEELAVHLLFNEGVALTEQAVSAWAAAAERQGKVKWIRVPAKEAAQHLAGFALPKQGLELVVHLPNRADAPITVLRRVGVAEIGGGRTEVFELACEDHPGGRALVEAVRRWTGRS